MRKTYIATAAAAVMLVASFAGLEETGATAFAAEANAESIVSETALTDEVVPVFVEGEVVQEVPAEPESDQEILVDAPQAETLHQLVQSVPSSGQLSEEMRCLAGAIYFEARGEPLEGQLAVAQVVINRSESRQFPSSYCGVVYQRAQFSFVRGGSMPQIKQGSAAWKRAKSIARIAHQGMWESEADDSLYFHANYVRPSWAKRKTARATIKTHIFYR